MTESPGVRRGGASMALLLSISIVSGSAAQTEHQAGIIGLLTLPQLSGEVDCEPPAPREVSLHAQPRSSDIVGSIRAHQDSSDADCYRAILKVHRPDGSVRDLPTEEYQEERPRAAIVVEVRDRWFKVRLEDGAAWLEASPRDDYMALEELLVLRPAHLTQAWDGKLAASPGGPSRRAPGDPRRRPLGYVEPVLRWVRVVATPGQDPEEVATQYNSRHWGSQPGPNGTRILDIETGAPISGFERPDRAAPVVASFHAQKCDDALRTTGMKAAVLARRSGWVQVALRRAEWRDEPRVWIEVSPHWRFHAFAADAERDEFEDEVFGREHSSVTFRRARVVAGRLWLEVEVMSHTIYDSVEPPRVVATGWVPAHAPSGESVVWFSSRD